MAIRIEYGAPLDLVGAVAQEGGLGRFRERAREQSLQEARFMADQQQQQAQFMASQQQRAVDNQMRGRQLAESAMENRAQFALRAGMAGDQARRQWYDVMGDERYRQQAIGWQQDKEAGRLDWYQERQYQQFEQQKLIEEQRIEGRMGLAQRNEVAKIRQKMAALQGGARPGARMPLVPAAAQQQHQALQAQLDGIFGEASKQAEASEVNEAAESERDFNLNSRVLPDGTKLQRDRRTGNWNILGKTPQEEELDEMKSINDLYTGMTYEKVEKDPTKLGETRTRVVPKKEEVLARWKEMQEIRALARANREGRSPSASPTRAQAEAGPMPREMAQEPMGPPSPLQAGPPARQQHPAFAEGRVPSDRELMEWRDKQPKAQLGARRQPAPEQPPQMAAFEGLQGDKKQAAYKGMGRLRQAVEKLPGGGKETRLPSGELTSPARDLELVEWIMTRYPNIGNVGEDLESEEEARKMRDAFNAAIERLEKA